MRNDGVDSKGGSGGPKKEPPLPTTQFRRRAWLEFQRALDPLAPPKPLRLKRR
jgi:hypothetical protein